MKNYLFYGKTFLVLAILVILGFNIKVCSPTDENRTTGDTNSQSISPGYSSENTEDTVLPPNFVQIKGGTFIMGSPANEADRGDDEVQHKVTVSSFKMSKYQVTQKEWSEVMGTTVRQQRDKANSSWDLYGEGDNYPMYYVSWYEAIEYCNKRSIKEKLTPAYTIVKDRKDPNNESEYDDVKWIVTWNKKANGYRLPTEAEWEYACRAGTTTTFSTGNNITTEQANYNGKYPYNNNAKGIYRETTTPVGTFKPNPWGLYDMHGNVFEWCWDWYDENYYSSSPSSNPDKAVSGYYRVLRGGSWDYNALGLRSAFRNGIGPGGWSNDFGFRLVRP